MSVLKTCVDCDLPFATSNTRATQCLPCWKKDREYDMSKADTAHILLQNHMRRLMLLYDHVENTRARSSNSGSSLSDKQIKRLLILCHPDKHDNSEMATEMTQLLNGMRTPR